MGSVAALIDEVLPAKVIVESMVNDAAQILRRGNAMVSGGAKL